MTGQVAERIFLDSKSYPLCSTPLSSYFDLSGTASPFVAENTACWRGYVGSWEISHKRLYLIELSGTLADGNASDLESVFPGFPDRVFAHWYTGTLRIPQGNLLKYVHGGWLSTYEFDLLIDVEKGMVIGRHLQDNRDEQFEER